MPGKLNMASTPPQLVKYLQPHIDKLLTTPWFKTAQEYFAQPPKIKIIDVTTSTPEILNILGELTTFVNSRYDELASYIMNPENNDEIPNVSQNTKSLAKIRELLNKINPEKLTKTQRHAIRKYIEITSVGKSILSQFYTSLKARKLIDPDLQLILNKYTSVINLGEIYTQCNEYTQIDYAVPELGINKATLHLYYPESKRNTYLSLTEKSADGNPGWLADAIHRICFFNKLLVTKNQPRGIHIFLCEFRKEFMRVQGQSDLIFTPSEINTGVCDMTDIIITRSEESLKTLLHELIHFHYLDFKHPLHDDVCARIFNIDSVQSSFNLFEAHTECLASTLHCISRSIPGPKFAESFTKIFTHQVWYTIKKAAQILAVNNYNELSEFIHLDQIDSAKNSRPITNENLPIKESTNVFSYFFVKTFIYLGLDKWLSGCCNAKTCKFLNTQRCQDTLLEIIKDGARNPLLHKLVDSRIDKPTAGESLKMVWIK